ncbi:hypothetical protein [Chryseobacterium wangxinyae]|nr:hypothetical protein [Chryseobacterium sp. CY353]MCY0968755.1 hypothetical protein [Chryseobacterium sp. CY353]
MSIGNNIRRIRTKSKKTQQEIADLLVLSETPMPIGKVKPTI